MAVIYCNKCHIGVHYIDLCPGGANGYPKKTRKQMLKAYAIYYTIVAVIAAMLFSFIALVVGI